MLPGFPYVKPRDTAIPVSFESRGRLLVGFELYSADRKMLMPEI